jgi:predicted dehydrogenase
MTVVTAVAIGAGQRGHHTFGKWALEHPDRLRYVAVVDPDATRRSRFGDPHGIANEYRFATVEELFAREPLADAAVVTSPDRMHFAGASGALAAGYHVLLEKPMASTLEETERLVQLATESDRIVQVAHVLRYTPFFRTLNDVVTSGRIGDLVTVEHRENVAAWHMAHSFVRGNWANTAQATPMIVQKCCHDFDILAWNLDSPVARLSSVGSLFHFTPDRRPSDATDRCIEGCPVADCAFDARRIYLTEQVGGWPIHVITDDYSREGREHALREGPYGRCVYTAGSDVVDHQVVMMELVSGASAVLVFHGHSHEEQRTMRYDGTKATVRGVFGRTQRIEVIDHGTRQSEEVPIPTATGGHGGGDSRLIETFVESVRTGAPVTTSAMASLESHRLAFAAEEARLTGRTIDMAAFRPGRA